MDRVDKSRIAGMIRTGNKTSDGGMTNEMILWWWWVVGVLKARPGPNSKEAIELVGAESPIHGQRGTIENHRDAGYVCLVGTCAPSPLRKSCDHKALAVEVSEWRICG